MSKWQRWKGIMKCYPFSEDRLLKWQPPYIVQPKYDGFRCRAVPISSPQGSSHIFLSSEENIFYSVPHLQEEITCLGLSAELDGELYCHGMSFDEISSIVSRTVNIHPDHKKIQFHVFDIVNEMPQMKRLLQIENLKGFSPWFRVAPFWLCESLDDVMRAYDQVIKQGYEGIIVRHFQAPYERKRSTLVMKFKPKKSDEYVIVRLNEEIDKNGRPKNSLGSFVCIGADGETFNVGTGFTEDHRREYWNKGEDLIGKVCKVSYQHLTAGKKVPRFPVFMEVIEDDRIR